MLEAEVAGMLSVYQSDPASLGVDIIKFQHAKQASLPIYCMKLYKYIRHRSCQSRRKLTSRQQKGCAKQYALAKSTGTGSGGCYVYRGRIADFLKGSGQIGVLR